MDIVRVLRILEYVGPRDVIEHQILNSLHGQKTFKISGKEITIRVATIGEYPEILEKTKDENGHS